MTQEQETERSEAKEVTEEEIRVDEVSEDPAGQGSHPEAEFQGDSASLLPSADEGEAKNFSCRERGELSLDLGFNVNTLTKTDVRKLGEEE